MTKAWRHFVLLRSCFFLSDRRVPPGECGSTSSDENPGTNGVIIKLAAEHGIKAKSAILQALIVKGASIPAPEAAYSKQDLHSLAFNNLIRQLICVRRCSGKMRRQYLADFANRFGERVAEFFILKMSPHSIHYVLPELFAAFFVNRLVANNGEFVGPRRYENKDGVALASLVHSETLKFLLRNRHRIGLEFAALNINTNFAGGFRFRFTNRAHNSCMLKPAEKVSRSLRSPTRSRAAAAKTSASAAEPAKSAATSTAR